MNKKSSLGPLYLAIKGLLKWFKKTHCSGIIIGGIAASLLGKPRTTRDIDALVFVDENKWPEFLKTGENFGFYPRNKDILKFAEQNRILLLTHKPTHIDIDISFGFLPFEKESLNRAITLPIGGITIPLPTPEDLIIMKAVAHRHQDLLDIEGIIEANPELDFKRIKYWVKEFAEVLETKEIFDDIRKLLPKKSR